MVAEDMDTFGADHSVFGCRGKDLSDRSGPAAVKTPTPIRRSGPKIDNTATGLAAFTGQWQMNDFLFLLVVENLKPVAQVAKDETRTQQPTRKATWFVVTSEQGRQPFVTTIAAYI